jgi:N-acetylglucosaminyl-diphospho-decaprenol L-rhamnosyltransferase
MRKNISYIIVTHNSERDIRGCIGSIYERCAVPFEIVVVDNNSQDLTRKIVEEEFGEVKLISSEMNNGYSWGVNTGVSHSKGDFVFILNPDTKIVSTITEDVFRPFSSDKIGVVGPKVINPEDKRRQASARSFPTLKTGLFNNRSLITAVIPDNRFSAQYLNPIIDEEKEQQVDWVSGCAMVIRRELFDLVGGFDESFFLFYEDVDFCQRASRAGYRVLYHPSIEIEHTIGISANVPGLRINYIRHRGMWHYYRRYFRRNVVIDLMVIMGIACRFLVTSVKVLLTSIFPRGRRG